MGTGQHVQPSGIGPQVLVKIVPFTGASFWGYPMFDPRPIRQNKAKKTWELESGATPDPRDAFAPGVRRWTICTISQTRPGRRTSFAQPRLQIPGLFLVGIMSTLYWKGGIHLENRVFRKIPTRERPGLWRLRGVSILVPGKKAYGWKSLDAGGSSFLDADSPNMCQKEGYMSGL